MSDNKEIDITELIKKGLENLTEDELGMVNDAYMKTMFSHLDPFTLDDNPEHCLMCKWEGKRSECNMIEVNTPASSWRALAGREGWEWKCPSCGFTVARHYTRMS